MRVAQIRRSFWRMHNPNLIGALAALLAMTSSATACYDGALDFEITNSTSYPVDVFFWPVALRGNEVLGIPEDVEERFSTLSPGQITNLDYCRFCAVASNGKVQTVQSGSKSSEFLVIATATETSHGVREGEIVFMLRATGTDAVISITDQR